MSTGGMINMSPVERIARIAVGSVAIIAGIVLLTTAGTAVAVILEILFGIAGLDLVITGAMGHCPLYARLGHVPAAARGRS